MDFRLKVFKTVAEQLSFTKASQALFISQPAISKHVRQLESHFGKALFKREGKHISLTPEGEIVLRYAEEILANYDRLEAEFLESEGKFPDRLALGASTTIAQYVLPRLLAKLKTANPNTQVRLVSGNSAFIESMVQNRDVDLGLTEGTAHNGLRFDPFVRDEIVLATRVDNPRVQGGDIRLKELPTLPLLIRETGSGTRNVIDAILHKKKMAIKDLNIDMVLGSSESMKNYLIHSEVFAFISIHAIAKELRRRELRIVDVAGLDIARQFYFVNTHGHNSYAAERLKNFFAGNYNLME